MRTDPHVTGPVEEDVAVASPTRWLLLLPFVAVLWVASYNGVTPTLFSVPLFFWYQLLWVLLCAVVIGVVYKAEHPSDRP